jgi:chromosome segregation ATPase
MDTLYAVRAHKSAFATAVSQAPEGHSATEVKLLEFRLKAREVEDAKMRSVVKGLEDAVVRLQAELKTQQQATPNRPSAADLDCRLAVLEVARQAADTWQSEHATELSNLSAQQQTLHTKIKETEKSCTETNSKATSLDKGIKDINQDLRDLRETHETLCKDVADYIGPVREAFVPADKLTVLQRVANLEVTSKSISKEQGYLSSHMESLSSGPFVKQEDFQALKSAVDSLEEHKETLSQDINTKITHLSNAHDQLSTCVKELTEDKTASTNDSDNNADLSPSEERLLALEKNTTDLSDGLNKLRTIVKVNETEFFEIFGGYFDPLKASFEEHKAATEKELQSVKERLQLTEKYKTAIDEKLQSCDRTLTELSDSRAKQPQGSERELLQQMGEVKEGLTHLRNNLNNVTTDTAQLKTATGNLEQALALKQNTAQITDLISRVEFAVENLQERYDNIYTENLFSKMSHWVLQQYPNSTAGILQQLKDFTCKYDLDQLRAFTDVLSQMPDSAQALVALAKLRPQIVALVEAPPGSMQSQEATARYEKGLSKLESIEKTVSGLQESMHALDPDNLPFVREKDLQQGMSTLRDDLETALSELRTGFKQTGDELKLETEKSDQLSRQIESLKQDAAKLRDDTNGALEEFRDPVTSHCIYRLPMLFTHAGQLQVAVETLNGNLPRGPLKLKWDHDFKELFDVSSPFVPDATRIS